jgi:1-deoxy-D-xylulose-5-phosphate reductoisomerase
MSPLPPRPKRVVLLGATGSIGESALRVIAAHPDRLELVAVAAHSRSDALAGIARRFPSVRQVGLFDATAADAAASSGVFPAGVRLHRGREGLIALSALPEADLVLLAVVGTAGFEPALAALEAGKDLALASKEVIVLGGKFVMAAARASKGRLLPVDSEHNALFQCLEGRSPSTVARIVLTASGGAFRDWPAERLRDVTPADALKHPNWAMGPKITVDSATLANKGLELIEAQCLFGLRADQCQAVLHPQSIVHSLVEFTDGVMLAQLCPPSMTFPIQHALLYPDRAKGVEAPLALDKLLQLDFRPVDETRFPLLRLAKACLQAGGAAPAVYNAANEVAVAAFLDHRLGFLDLSRVVERTLDTYRPAEAGDLTAVREIDLEARRVATAALIQR